VVEADIYGNKQKGALYQMSDGLFVKQNYSSGAVLETTSTFTDTFAQKNITDYISTNAGAVNSFQDDAGAEGISFSFASPSINATALQYRLEYAKSLAYFWQMGTSSIQTNQKIIDIAPDTQ